MYINDDDKDERDPFELFGDAPEAIDDPLEEMSFAAPEPRALDIEPEAPAEVRGGLFMGRLHGRDRLAGVARRRCGAAVRLLWRRWADAA
ncbi:MAG: hypothetical protein NVV62_05890 [Terricaulis sp.]|nr:hypothetical protein [Terricaulis sp.]